MSDSTREEEEVVEGMYALPVPVRVIAGVLCGGDGDGICISNHRLTHLQEKQEELRVNNNCCR